MSKFGRDDAVGGCRGVIDKANAENTNVKGWRVTQASNFGSNRGVESVLEAVGS